MLLFAGLAGVWSKDNTRESLWDAFKRKEVYATTGTRMTVRLFAGWDYSEDAVHFKWPLPQDVPATQQDRAYTSPIWYTPE